MHPSDHINDHTEISKPWIISSDRISIRAKLMASSTTSLKKSRRPHPSFTGNMQRGSIWVEEASKKDETVDFASSKRASREPLALSSLLLSLFHVISRPLAAAHNTCSTGKAHRCTRCARKTKCSRALKTRLFIGWLEIILSKHDGMASSRTCYE